MPRWAANGRERLEAAAIELFLDRGFDRVTAPAIAERAGLTDRTFYRHFGDKREILFSGQEALQQTYESAIAAAPASASPLDAVGAALLAVADGFFPEGRRAFAEQRHVVIQANAGLQERELLKRETLAAAIAAALRQRGVDALEADLAADSAMAVFKRSYRRWVEGDPATLPELLRTSLDRLRAVAG